MTGSTGRGSGLEWFVRRGKAVRGPYSSARVRHFVAEGRLELEDEVSPDRQAWRRVGDVDEVVPPELRGEEAIGAGQDAEQRRQDRYRAIRATLVATLLVATLIVLVLWVGDSGERRERDCSLAPGPGVFLEGCVLSDIDLTGADLVGIGMANAVLARARLGGADLSRADLRYADLSGVDLSYATLSGANLKGANLRGADLTNADLRDADMTFADLSRARLGGARLQGAGLEGALWTDGRRCTASDCPR